MKKVVKKTTKKSTSKKTPVKDKKRGNRELLYKVITDPKFRQLLEKSPAKALNKRSLNEVQKREVKLVLTIAKNINYNISKLADQILCVNGPCGIA